MIIGFCGRMQSGKTTAAQVLVEEFGFTRMSFADPIREMMADIDPIVGTYDSGNVARYTDVVAEIGYEEAKRQFPEIRRLMQSIGVSARERIGEDVWIRAFENRALALPYEREELRIVVDDVRFLNEAEAIRDADGRVYRIERPGLPQSDHVSETEGDAIEVDGIFHNVSSEEWFKKNVFRSYLEGKMQ